MSRILHSRNVATVINYVSMDVPGILYEVQSVRQSRACLPHAEAPVWICRSAIPRAGQASALSVLEQRVDRLGA